MSDLKRDKIKYVRDYIKRFYKHRDKCYICGSKEKLELHHLYSLSELFNTWCLKNKIREINTVKEIESIRIRFREEHLEKLDNINLYTLCKEHHGLLHNIYSQTYSNALVPRIRRWLDIQKDKKRNN